MVKISTIFKANLEDLDPFSIRNYLDTDSISLFGGLICNDVETPKGADYKGIQVIVSSFK